MRLSNEEYYRTDTKNDERTKRLMDSYFNEDLGRDVSDGSKFTLF